MTTPHGNPPLTDVDDNDITGRLLRLAGARRDADDERVQRVRQAVLMECRVAARRRRVIRRVVTVGVGLSLAATVALAVRLWKPAASPTAAPGEAIATVVRLEGTARLVTTERDGLVRDLAASATIRAGDSVQTTPDGRLALRLADASIRFDVASRARLVSATVIELTEGALYFDHPGGGAGIEVRTPVGTVRDIGTQFEVRVMPSSLRVRVRSGLVTLRAGNDEVPARPGTELLVVGDRVVGRTVAVYGAEWAWTASIAPSIAIEGRPLGTVLGELCREHGWTLRYAEPSLARAASGAILHGSIAGLSPEETSLRCSPRAASAIDCSTVSCW